MQKLDVSVLLQQLWNRVDSSDPAILKWQFTEAERPMLRASEKYLRHWAWQHRREVEIEIGGATGIKSLHWRIAGRFSESVQYNFPAILPMTLPDESGSSGSGSDRFIVCASNPLPRKIYSMLEELGDSDSVRAIVHWGTQKQVVMNAACQNIPIGDSLEECLNWSRHDYWLHSDLDQFERRCQQELNLTDGNEITMTYLTYDPVDLREGGDGDWIRVTGKYAFIDCDRFGLFQISQNLDFEKVAPP